MNPTQIRLLKRIRAAAHQNNHHCAHSEVAAKVLRDQCDHPEVNAGICANCGKAGVT